MNETGYLQLKVEKRKNQSVITDSFYNGVLKITRPTYLFDELPLLTLIHVGGGYIDGDTYYTNINVEQEASIALTTQASTKVYKSPRLGAKQKTDYHLKENSHLFMKQDPLILYQDAVFTQLTDIYMHSSSVFYYTDIITPGWSESGKLFQYKQFTSKMRIYMNEKLAVFDHLRLNPENDLSRLMYLEGFSHVGNLFFIHPQVTDVFIAELRERLSSFVTIRVGVSLMSIDGCILKILANGTPEIEAVFTICEHVIAEFFYAGKQINWRKG